MFFSCFICEFCAKVSIIFDSHKKKRNKVREKDVFTMTTRLLLSFYFYFFNLYISFIINCTQQNDSTAICQRFYSPRLKKQKT